MKITEKFALKTKNPMTGDIPTLAFLGDSVTQGCFEIYLDSDNKVETVRRTCAAYHSHIRDAFSLLYPTCSINIVNAGISGDSAIGGYKRLQKDVLKFNPDLVVVSFGLNDSCRQSEDSLEKYKEALKNIFRDIKESGSEAIFMTANMMNTYVSHKLKEPIFIKIAKMCMECENSGRLKMFFDAGCNVAKEMGIPVCDVYSKWRRMKERGVDVTTLLANDINHPNEEMHKLFAFSLLETIFSN